jgi:hypothetical protein
MSGKQVVLGAYGNVMHAELVKDRLEVEGIPAFVADDAMGHLYPGALEPALGGIRVLVREEDLERAQDVLANLSHPLGSSADELTEEDLQVLEAEAEQAAPEDDGPAAGADDGEPPGMLRTLVVVALFALLAFVGIGLYFGLF